MAQNEGPAPIPRLVSDMNALEDAYEEHVNHVLEKLLALLGHHDHKDA